MSAGVALAQAFDLIAGCSGKIALCIERKKPVPKHDIFNMVQRLRRAADILEELLK